MVSAPRRQKQGDHEFLGQAKNLSQEGMRLKLLGLVTRVVPSSLEGENGGEGRKGGTRVVCGAEVEKAESSCTNSCREALPQIMNTAVPPDPAVQLMGTDQKELQLCVNHTV